ncbi:MAG: hypothetical protein AAB896_02430, partial [Patescibacteria group bacterium]
DYHRPVFAKPQRHKLCLYPGPSPLGTQDLLLGAHWVYRRPESAKPQRHKLCLYLNLSLSGTDHRRLDVHRDYHRPVFAKPQRHKLCLYPGPSPLGTQDLLLGAHWVYRRVDLQWKAGLVFSSSCPSQTALRVLPLFFSFLLDNAYAVRLGFFELPVNRDF